MYKRVNVELHERADRAERMSDDEIRAELADAGLRVTAPSTVIDAVLQGIAGSEPTRTSQPWRRLHVLRRRSRADGDGCSPQAV